MEKKPRTEERLRKFINLQYVKIKRTAAVGSLIMLILNLSFTVYPFIKHRDVHPYVAVPLLFFTIFFLVWIASHVYVRKMEMYRTESLADKIYNPYSVYAIGPFEEMKYRNMEIPLMEGVLNNLPEGENKQKLKEQIDKVKRWCDLGYIPKQEFPKHLRRYYITKKENRL